MPKFLKILALVILITFTACDTVPVAEELGQAQAREVVAELSKYGVSAVAERGSGSRAKYNVMVRGVQYHQAVQLLEESSLPKESKASFYDLVEPKGLVPNSRAMEDLRLDRAMAVELEDIISAYPGIKSVSALLRLNFRNEDEKPAVSVLLKVKKGNPIKYEDLSRIVKRTVPGIADEDIEIVSHVEAEYLAGSLKEVGAHRLEEKLVTVPLVPFLFKWQIPEGHYRSLVFVLIGVIAIVLLIGFLLGYWYGIYARSSGIIDGDASTPPNEMLRIDNPRARER